MPDMNQIGLQIAGGGVLVALGAAAKHAYGMWRQEKQDKRDDAKEAVVRYEKLLDEMATRYQKIIAEITERYESQMVESREEVLSLRAELRKQAADHEVAYRELHKKHVQCQIEAEGLRGRIDLLQAQVDQLRAGVNPVLNSPELWALACVMVDEAGTIRRANPYVTSLLHWEEEELIGRPVLKIIPPRFRAAHQAAFRAAVAEGRRPDRTRSFPLWALQKGGEEIPVTIWLDGWRDDGRWKFSAMMTRRPDVGDPEGSAEIPTGLAELAARLLPVPVPVEVVNLPDPPPPAPPAGPQPTVPVGKNKDTEDRP
jgi:PAS domain S-box-containing protein